MVLNSEGHPENPLNSMQQFASLGKGEFIPARVRDYSGNFKPPGNSLEWLEHELERAREFISWAPVYLQDRLFYVPFLQKEGLMTEGDQRIIENTTDLLPTTSFERQTSAELAKNTKFQDFLATHTPPREILLKTVREVVLSIPTVRDAEYNPDSYVKAFDRSMRTGRYIIALALIPDLTDAEVKTLFGEQASLAEIKTQIPTQ